MKKLIIVLCGPKQSGKSTFSDYAAKLANAAEVPVAVVSFAQPIKDFLESVGIPRECLHGTDEQKNMPQEGWKWESAGDPDEHLRVGTMTAREIMQVFGTNIMRAWVPDIWACAATKRIRDDKAGGLYLIPDCRFPNEIDAMESLRSENTIVKLVRLTRKPFEDTHASETALDARYNGRFDLVVPPDLNGVAAQNEWTKPYIEAWLREVGL